MAQSGTVTLLFTDLVDSTRHLQRAGDEAGQRLLARITR
jgi:class 3 adenylate cyclase